MSTCEACSARHGVWLRSMALRMVIILRMQAVSATCASSAQIMRMCLLASATVVVFLDLLGLRVSVDRLLVSVKNGVIRE